LFGEPDRHAFAETGPGTGNENGSRHRDNPS
jgi:hypothetical protein